MRKKREGEKRIEVEGARRREWEGPRWRVGERRRREGGLTRNQGNPSRETLEGDRGEGKGLDVVASSPVEVCVVAMRYS